MADSLGLSPRPVECYRAEKLTKPQKGLPAASVEAAESVWKPQFRARARVQTSTSGGMMGHVVADSGFTAGGSSGDGRERRVTTAMPPTASASATMFDRWSPSGPAAQPGRRLRHSEP